MWELDHKESLALKNWCFWTVVLEETLESPLDFKEIKPVNPKGNKPWIFIERTDAEAEASILWLPDAKSWLIEKDPDAGKDWRWEEKGMTEDEMVGWYHRHDGHEFEQAPGVGNGQGSLTCCSPQGCRVGQDWATELTELKFHNTVIVIYLIRGRVQAHAYLWNFHYATPPVWPRPPSRRQPFPKGSCDEILPLSLLLNMVNSLMLKRVHSFLLQVKVND